MEKKHVYAILTGIVISFSKSPPLPFGGGWLVISVKYIWKLKWTQWRIRGGAVTHTPLGQNSFIFMEFSAKSWQNNRLEHPLQELVPPLENPGSTTGTANGKWRTQVRSTLLYEDKMTKKIDLTRKIPFSDFSAMGWLLVMFFFSKVTSWFLTTDVISLHQLCTRYVFWDFYRSDIKPILVIVMTFSAQFYLDTQQKLLHWIDSFLRHSFLFNPESFRPAHVDEIGYNFLSFWLAPYQDFKPHYTEIYSR